jgi:hypothetical protein
MKPELISMEEFDRALEQRVSALRDEYESRIEALQAKSAMQNAKLSGLLIDNEIRSLASKPEVGVLPKAVSTVVMLAKEVWRMDQDGKPVAIDADGRPIYGKRGEPIDMAEWMESLKDEAPYLFGEP